MNYGLIKMDILTGIMVFILLVFLSFCFFGGAIFFTLLFIFTVHRFFDISYDNNIYGVLTMICILSWFIFLNCFCIRYLGGSIFG